MNINTDENASNKDDGPYKLIDDNYFQMKDQINPQRE